MFGVSPGVQTPG